MTRAGFWEPLRPPDRGSAWVAALGVVLPVADVQLGNPDFYRGVVAPLMGLTQHPLAEMHVRCYQFLLVFVLFFLVPVLVWRFGVGQRLADAGLCLGDWRFGWKSSAVAAAVVLPLVFLSAGQADFQAEYPLSRVAAQEVGRFAFYEAILLFYYVGWEFLFRGFLLFGVRRSAGDFWAVVVQTFPSVLLHIGKPAGELWGSVVAGFLFGAWALRTRSVLWVLVFHYYLGVVNDVFCAWRGGLFG